jgi:amicyanin
MKRILPILIAVVALLAIGGFVFSSNRTQTNITDAPNADQTAQTESDAPLTTNEATGSSSQSNQTSTNKVEMKNTAFNPSKITIKKGTTVTWTNQDSDRHDVTPDNESDAFQGSELLSKGESYSFTFNTVGTYSYHCTPHPFMRGTVEVVE